LKNINVENIFTEIIDRVKIIDPVNTRNWFEKLKVLNFDGGSMQIGCPDDETAVFLRDNCRTSFTRAAQQITGYLVTIDFRKNTPQNSAQPDQGGFELKLHPDYTFENFVVGPSNRLAHASCVAVSQSPGKTYNPLFIYGNSGLGKTHLLHAICRETKQRFEKAVIKFLSCEEFINHYIRAIRESGLSGFQSQFRNVDTLIIDDVQFLSEREQSQEEFFHTFNALYNDSKQIILSADCPPTEIPSLEERLISRFNWGLVSRVDPPTYETRVAIVQKKAQLRGLYIPEEIAEYTARKFHNNIRELEGALTSLCAVASTTGQAITMEMAQQVLEDNIDTARRINITDIIDVVTRHFNIRLTDLQSKKRSQSITEPRQICMYLARSLTKHSLEEIGGHLGGRDHTTVMHACAKIGEANKTDPKLADILRELEKQVIQQPRSVKV
jgi:chromosomal replication initiator protein